MLSRFNLDQKRMNYYDNIEQFNKDFVNISSQNNENDHFFDTVKPTVIVNKDKTLKLSLYRNDKEFNYILFSNQSISVLPSEKFKIHKAIKEFSNFEIFNLNY